MSLEKNKKLLERRVNLSSKVNTMIPSTQSKPTQTTPKAGAISSAIGSVINNKATKSNNPQPMTDSLSTPKQQPVFQSYNPNAQVDANYSQKARDLMYGFDKDELYNGYDGGFAKGGDWISNEQANEVGYYLQLQDQLGVGQLLNKYQSEELSKGYGLINGWENKYTDLVDAQKQWYALQDFMADKYNINGTNDRTDGLSRANLGFNEAVTSFDHNQTYNPYNHLAAGTFFNDPRNAGKEFAWQQYLDPTTALQGERQHNNTLDALDFYYNSNFAREHGYISNEKTWDFNADAPWDWENISAEDMVKQFGIGGTEWGGNIGNYISYQQRLADIISKQNVSPTPITTVPTLAPDTPSPSLPVNPNLTTPSIVGDTSKHIYDNGSGQSAVNNTNAYLEYLQRILKGGF